VNELSVFPRHTAGRSDTDGIVIIDLHYRWLGIFLVATSLIVIGLGIFRKVLLHWPENHVVGTLELINLQSDNSLPEWWSVAQFFLASLLLMLNGAAEPDRRWKRYWVFLATIFVFLSIDESAGVHERVRALIPHDFTGALMYSWVIPYAAACLVIATLYIPFLLALPREVGLRMFFAGALFILAAMGAECVEGYCQSNALWHCVESEQLVEESGEIIAIMLFILALLMLLRTRTSMVTLKLC
jgi:hypothetical protein